MIKKPRETALQACLAALIIFSTLAWSFSFISFHDAKILVLWLGLILLVVLRGKHVSGLFEGFGAWLPAWIGLAVAGIGGLVWARVPWLSVAEFLRNAALLLVAGLAYEGTRSARGRRVVFSAIVCAAFIAAVLALMQRAGWLSGWFPVFGHYDQPMYSVFGNEGLLGGYLALGLVLLPGALGLETDRVPRWLFLPGLLAAAVMFSALILSASRAGHLALLGGVLVLFITFSLRARHWRTPLAISFLMAVFAVAVLGGESAEKWITLLSGDDVGMQVRAWIWRASISMAIDHPVGGVGLGNFAYWVPQYMGGAATDYSNDAITYHAHFDLFELGCETGLLGLLFLVWLLSRYRLRSSCAFSGAVVFVIFSCLHPAWASLPHALSAVLLVGMNLERGWVPYSLWETLKLRERALWHIAVLMVAVCAVLHAALVLRPSFLLRYAEDTHLAGEDAELAYRAATTGPGFRGEAHESYGIYLLECGNNAGALREFIAARNELDTGRLYQLLAKAATALGQHEAALEYSEEGLLRWPWAKKVFSDSLVCNTCPVSTGCHGETR